MTNTWRKWGCLHVLSATLILWTIPVMRAQVQVNPCNATGTMSAVSRGSLIGNENPSCNTFVLTYWSSGGVTGLSIELDGAQDTSVGVPGAWSLLSATPIYGSNPSTALSGLIVITTYMPLLSVNLTSLTGSGTVNWRFGGTPLARLGTGGGGGGGGSLTVELNGVSQGTVNTMNIANSTGYTTSGASCETNCLTVTPTIDTAIFPNMITSNTWGAGATQNLVASAASAGLGLSYGTLPNSPAEGNLAVDPNGNLNWYGASEWNLGVAADSTLTSGAILIGNGGTGGNHITTTTATGTGSVVLSVTPSLTSPSINSFVNTPLASLSCSGGQAFTGTNGSGIPQCASVVGSVSVNIGLYAVGNVAPGSNSTSYMRGAIPAAQQTAYDSAIEAYDQVPSPSMACTPTDIWIYQYATGAAVYTGNVTFSVYANGSAVSNAQYSSSTIYTAIGSGASWLHGTFSSAGTIAASSLVEIQVVTPTWTTAPTGVSTSAYITCLE